MLIMLTVLGTRNGKRMIGNKKRTVMIIHQLSNLHLIIQREIKLNRLPLK